MRFLTDFLTEGFIYGFADGLWLMAYFKENVEEFGVCSVYRCGGKENVSEMAVYRPDGSSVETISDRLRHCIRRIL